MAIGKNTAISYIIATYFFSECVNAVVPACMIKGPGNRMRSRRPPKLCSRENSGRVCKSSRVIKFRGPSLLIVYYSGSGSVSKMLSPSF